MTTLANAHTVMESIFTSGFGEWSEMSMIFLFFMVWSRNSLNSRYIWLVCFLNSEGVGRDSRDADIPLHWNLMAGRRVETKKRLTGAGNLVVFLEF